MHLLRDFTGDMPWNIHNRDILQGLAKAPWCIFHVIHFFKLKMWFENLISLDNYCLLNHLFPLFEGHIKSSCNLFVVKYQENKPLEEGYVGEKKHLIILAKDVIGCRKMTSLSCCLPDCSMWQTNRQQ